VPPDASPLERRLAGVRVAFVASAPEPYAPGQKTHLGEARAVAQLTGFYRRLYAASGMPWEAGKTLGIITPWRAQIAQIRAALLEAGEPLDGLTIDTVERYQGGARDVILVSTAVHTAQQLQALVNRSVEGIDRKLNVALTRARSHVVLLGNPDVLGQDPDYAAFIAAATAVQG
jgi:DNA replication ATP-dependent helicase Dna2